MLRKIVSTTASEEVTLSNSLEGGLLRAKATLASILHRSDLKSSNPSLQSELLTVSQLVDETLLTVRSQKDASTKSSQESMAGRVFRVWVRQLRHMIKQLWERINGCRDLRQLVAALPKIK